MYGTIYDYIREQEIAYEKPITLDDGWDWSMKDHLRKSFLYKNSQFVEQNENRDLRPNKNIILAIRNVENRTEGFDVKDIEIYVDDADEYYKSFLVKKYHEKWALEHKIDTFIDDVVDSYGDYGGALVRNTNESRPEVVDLKSLAFANQTDILAYPFCIKHRLSPSQLKEYKTSGWGEDSNGATIGVDDLIFLCKDEPEIEVYELHGILPKRWEKDNSDAEESEEDSQQIQIVAYYQKEEGNEQGVTLFKKKEPKLPFKFLSRDKIIGRALGRGGVEALFEPQKWTNWNEIKVTEMLEAASKIINLTDDPSVISKHPSGLKNMTNLEFVQVGEGKKGVWQVDNYPRNLAVFNDSLERWAVHAQQLGSASETLLSGEVNSGTPFKLYEAKQMEDKSMHKFRQGQIAVFVDEIYRDWILPHFGTEITKDHKFLTELSADEMQAVSEAVVKNEANRMVKEKILNGMIVDPMAVEGFKQLVSQEFAKGGNKKFIEILKGEMKKEKLSVMTNIAGKQKNLALLTDKVVNVLRQFLATPQLRQDPEMTKLLNVILESSGMSPIMFGSAPAMQQQPQQPMQQLQPMPQQSYAQ